MNAFLQAAAKKRTVSKSRHIDVEMLTISNDEFPGRRSSPEGKYSAFFEKMKPGQCIKCEPAEAQPLGTALRKWLIDKEQDKALEVRVMQRFHKDGRGRVWLLPKEPALRKVA